MNDFEGSVVLEKLAELELVDDFYEAVDADNLLKVEELMRRAGISHATIAKTLSMIENGDQ